MLISRFMELRATEHIGPDVSVSTYRDQAAMLLGAEPTIAGPNVNEGNAEGISAVYACVRLLSDSIAQVPFKLFRRTQDGREPDEQHPLHTLIHDLPNPEMTSFDLRVTMARWLFLWGNAYAEIDRRPDGSIRAIWPLRSDMMVVDRDRLNRLRYRYTLADGSERTWLFDGRRPPIWHWRINAMDGIHGRSPIRMARESFGLSKAAQLYGAKFFGNGGRPSGILTTDQRLNDESARRSKKNWQESHGNFETAQRVAVLEAGLKFQPIMIPPEDSQFIETQRNQVEDTCRIYGVPPFMIGATTTSTSWGSGIEEQKIGFVTFTLTSHYEQIQQASKRDLLTQVSFNTHDCLFVLNALLRGDLSRRFSAYLTGHNRWLTTNEIRALEDLNPIDGGDVMGTPAGTAAGPPASTTPGAADSAKGAANG